MNITEYKALLAKPKKKRRRDEDLLCMAFTDHCHTYFPEQQGRLVWTHIANEGRSPSDGSKLKKMGVHAGWFDYIFLSFYGGKLAVIKMEAKIGNNNYSDSQLKFIHMTNGMPIDKVRFYSVKEGHDLLVSFGVIPIKECTYFKEPSFITLKQKQVAAHNFYAPRKPT